ncbi:MAG: MCE family protein [Chlorobi bacterium]|nr:MCE family protein [Chlorobiota bacterium]
MKWSTEVKVGIIMVVTIVVFIWLFHFMKGLNFLKPSDSYYIVYERINGLEESNPILINGYKVGLVDAIDFMPDHSGRLVVKITLDKPYEIPKDSKAEIFSADLMGTQAIRILLGKTVSALEDGDTLVGITEGSLQEQVSAQMLPVKVKAENLLSSIDSVMAVIQSTFNKDFRYNFTKSFEDIRTTIDNLKRSTYTVDTFLTNKDGTMSLLVNNTKDVSVLLKSNLEKLDYVLSNLTSVSDSLKAADIKATVSNLNKTLEQTQILLKSVNAGEGTLGMLATNDSLYRAIESLTFRLDTLVTRIIEKPKKYLKISVF